MGGIRCNSTRGARRDIHVCNWILVLLSKLIMEKRKKKRKETRRTKGSKRERNMKKIWSNWTRRKTKINNLESKVKGALLLGVKGLNETKA